MSAAAEKLWILAVLDSAVGKKVRPVRGLIRQCKGNRPKNKPILVPWWKEMLHASLNVVSIHPTPRITCCAKDEVKRPEGPTTGLLV